MKIRIAIMMIIPVAIGFGTYEGVLSLLKYIYPNQLIINELLALGLSLPIGIGLLAVFHKVQKKLMFRRGKVEDLK